MKILFGSLRNLIMWLRIESIRLFLMKSSTNQPLQLSIACKLHRVFPPYNYIYKHFWIDPIKFVMTRPTSFPFIRWILNFRHFLIVFVWWCNFQPMILYFILGTSTVWSTIWLRTRWKLMGASCGLVRIMMVMYNLTLLHKVSLPRNIKTLNYI